MPPRLAALLHEYELNPPPNTAEGLAQFQKSIEEAAGEGVVGPEEAARYRAAGLNLSLISPVLRAQAWEAFEAGDGVGFLGVADNTRGLQIVADNFRPLKTRGIYEAALLYAFSGTRSNNLGTPLAEQRWLFELADRAKLRAASEPLPYDGPFTLFRGVAGVGPRRRLRGLSWTDDPNVACWFATRWGHESPAVLSGEFSDQDILAYLTDRQEAEWIVAVPRSTRIRTLRFSAEEIVERAQTHRGGP